MEDTTTHQHKYSTNPQNWRLLRSSQLANDVATITEAMVTRQSRWQKNAQPPQELIIIANSKGN